MAEGTVSISDVIWQKWVGKFAEATRKNLREAMYEEWPFLMRKVMDFTPPYKTKAAVKSSGSSSSASDLSVGRAAVAFDIYKTMRPFNPAARSPALEQVLIKKDIVAFNVIASRSQRAEMRGVTAVEFSEKRHTDARDRRGRVPGRDRRKVVLGSDVGLLKRYVAKVQGFVGFAKSGWLKALLLVGGEAPGYVTKQGTNGGDVIDNHADENEPSITAINGTPWAIRKDEGERILGDATASRIEAIMTKTRVAIRLAEAEANKAA
jgi:hypothetical protein